MIKKIFPFISIFFLILLIFIGCTKKPNPVNVQNQPPETYLLNVPPDSSYIYHARIIYWYGTDKDGIVTRYDWAIDSTEYVESIPGSGWHSLYMDSMLGTQDTIAFEAPLPDTIYTHLFYVRAVDNKGLPDPTPAHRVFSTSNIQPNTRFVSTPEDSSQRFILIDSTDIWRGINFEWMAIDSDQVFPCQYQYCWDDTSINFDPVTHKGWSDPVSDESFYFTGENSPYEEGYHTVYVRALDDAGAIDPSLSDIISIDSTVTPWDTTLYNQWVTVYFVKPQITLDSTYRKILWLNFAESANQLFVKPFYHTILGESLNVAFDSLDYNQSISDSINHRLFGEYSTIIWSKDDKKNWLDFPLDKKKDLITDFLLAGGRLIFTGSKILNMGHDFAPGYVFGVRKLFPFSVLHINKYKNIGAGTQDDTTISPFPSDTAFYSEDVTFPSLSISNYAQVWWFYVKQWLLLDALELDLWGDYYGKLDIIYSINHYRNNGEYERQPCATRFTYENRTMPSFFYFGFPLSYFDYGKDTELLRAILTELDEIP